MFKNYFRSLYRNIINNKFYTAINIIGLAIGIATALLILLYIQDELSYDKHYEKHKRIYRIESDITINNKHQQYAIAPFPLGPALKNEFPEIEESVRIDQIGNILFRYEEKEYYEDSFFLADSTVFNVFSHKFLLGSPKKSLTEPYSIVLTESIALKYFDEKNPLNKIITSGAGINYKITGVIEDLPTNAHLKYDALISSTTIENELGGLDFSEMKPSRFWRIGAFTYILLKENTSIEAIHDKFHVFYEKYMKDLGDQYNLNFNLMTTPLADTHFRQGLGGERPSGNMAYILIFSAVAVFILLLAVINYMNMATARSAGRAKEIGVRKVMGAHRNLLMQQFIGDSVILSVVAMFIALLVVALVIPEFNNFAGKSLSLSLRENTIIFIELIVMTVLVGIVSGSYPAFYLSSFQPVRVLKGSVSSTGKKAGMLRKVLVVIQFFIAIFMIIGAIVISSQIQYLKNKYLGFNKEGLVFMEVQDTTFRSKVDAFKNELLSNLYIQSVTNSTGIPGRINWIETMRIEQEGKMEEQAILSAAIDYDYVDVMGLEIIKGRNFDKTMGTDALESVIINETAAAEFNWENNPIGKKIHYGFEQDKSGGRMLKVIGVVQDFHFKSLHNQIEPVILFIGERPGYLLTCRIGEANSQETLAFIEEKWNEFNAKRPFNYKFLDNSMDEMYGAEESICTLIKIATLLTIFIALLGLLGLSSFTAEQKMKEVGLRKILGASTGNILYILSKEFALLIFIAFILAIPLSWWRLNIWLENSFIYHQELKWSYFLLAGLLAFIFGMATISFYIVRAASRNPIDAIKYE